MLCDRICVQPYRERKEGRDCSLSNWAIGIFRRGRTRCSLLLCNKPNQATFEQPSAAARCDQMRELRDAP